MINLNLSSFTLSSLGGHNQPLCSRTSNRNPQLFGFAATVGLKESAAPPPPPVDPFAALDALEELAGPAPEDAPAPVAPELQVWRDVIFRDVLFD